MPSIYRKEENNKDNIKSKTFNNYSLYIFSSFSKIQSILLKKQSFLENINI
jgi:hypothetical protein